MKISDEVRAFNDVSLVVGPEDALRDGVEVDGDGRVVDGVVDGVHHAVQSVHLEHLALVGVRHQQEVVVHQA